MNLDIVYSVTDFVAICNQVLDVSFGQVQITGELSNFKVSKNRWVYFDLKDDYSSLRFFGTVYNIPGPLQDGMLLTVSGVPQLHPKFGFSVTVSSIQLSGEGTIKKAQNLLEKQLSKEGLFDESRKRKLLYPPNSIGVISSSESAGYADFIKIINKRWGGLSIRLFDIQVQGEKAPGQITEAIQYFNQHVQDIDALVIIRGGGSVDDLQAFSHETVTRAVAGSRIPTLVAIGHETDMSLAEKAADLRASTPSNAAELLVPDKQAELDKIIKLGALLDDHSRAIINSAKDELGRVLLDLDRGINSVLQDYEQQLSLYRQVMVALSPTNALRRGYAVLRSHDKLVKSINAVSVGDDIDVLLSDGSIQARVVGHNS